jgi:hypothetical protein
MWCDFIALLDRNYVFIQSIRHIVYWL